MMPERRERDLIVLFTMTIAIQSSVFALALQWGGKWAEYAPFVFLGITIAVVAAPFMVYRWRRERKRRKRQNPISPY